MRPCDCQACKQRVLVIVRLVNNGQWALVIVRLVFNKTL